MARLPAPFDRIPDCIRYSTAPIYLPKPAFVLRGQIGQDLDSYESVGIGDAAAQAEKAMANVKILLEEAGS
jgi:enamine deaminase RidA (YjgF/YER057c/UK114 family)